MSICTVEPRKTGEEERVTQRYLNNLDAMVPEVARVEIILETAAQRRTRSHYAMGMLLGAFVLGLVCVLVGAEFDKYDTPAWYCVALPAGAVGALVSVFQRMTSGKLKLDIHTGTWMTVWYGALRPVIGGILGMAVFVLLKGGLLPAIEVAEGSELAFYAGLGFLAGFNERFAQDMLARSVAAV